MSELDLSQVQFGEETAWGTPVAGTAKLMGVLEASVQPMTEVHIPEKELRGSLAPGYQAALKAISGKGRLALEMTYEDPLFIVEGAFGEDAPSGAGPYTRDYVAPVVVGTSPTPRFHTFIYGDPDGVYKLDGAFPAGFDIEASSNEISKITADYLGKRVESGALAALSDRTVVPLMGDHWALFIDAWAGTIGTTAVATTALSFKLGVKLNYALKKYLGSLTPGGVRKPRWSGELSLRYEFNAVSKAYIDDIVAATAVHQKQIRLKATQGTNVFQIDYAGVAVGDPKIFDDEEGSAAVEVKYVPLYNPTLANWLKLQSVNGLAALP